MRRRRRRGEEEEEARGLGLDRDWIGTRESRHEEGRSSHDDELGGDAGEHHDVPPAEGGDGRLPSRP